ncbi:hypothetical protein [Pelagibaculum spongiae]|uniref:Zinc-dependent peptidase n=1 Tax=Pelagibaculum spongiae TaxID=2080658 RepID=A0A2V1H2C5_9GAMM|nr:hypothetical protein [Pelagibaculum spongiae]PVZ70592.1 hypothetical protein DC094_08410 [Pelagibaculum spongiae]
MRALVCLLLLSFSLLLKASPLSKFLNDSTVASDYSHQLSQQFNFPIWLIERPSAQLLEQLNLPQHPQKESWLARYQRGLSQATQAGFSLKIPGEYLPCMISLPGSYQSHVETPALIELLTEYPYNPWQGQAEAFNKMVLFHEIGHCFENLPDSASAERFADLFAVLMLGASEHTMQRQLNGRFFSLLKGDQQHFSNLALQKMFQDIATQYEPLPLDTVVSLATRYATQQQELSQVDRWVEYLRLHWAVMLDQQDLNIIGNDTSDDMEALRDQFISRYQQNLQIIYQIDESFDPNDYHEIKNLIISMAQQMLSVRLQRGELENQVQQGLFLADINLLFTSYGFTPINIEANMPFKEKLNRLMAANNSYLAPEIRLPIRLLENLED